MIKIIILIINIIFFIFKYCFQSANYDDIGISIIKLISEYNIIFVKIFQWTWMKNNSKNEYLTQKIKQYIYIYSNNTPFKEDDIDYKSILDTFITSKKLGNKFELEQINPVNSGSISLIFIGKLNENKVIIKLLRKNIKEQINNGLGFLANIENIVKYIPIISNLISNDIFTNNKQNILNQTDFINESENIQLFYDNFKNDKNLIIPNVYVDYTKINSNIIIMDYIDGKYLNELEEQELNEYFKYFVKFIVKSIFVKNIFHSDLHQGNILFTKKVNSYNKIVYKIGIIDFGMILKLNVDEVNFAYLWLMGIYSDQFHNLIDFIKNINNKDMIFKNNVTNENINICMNYMSQKYSQKEIFFCLDMVINDIYIFLKILKNHNCNLSSKCHYYLLSMIPIINLIYKLGPELDKKQIIKQELNKMSNANLLD